MKILSNKEINDIFDYTIEHDGVTRNELIDRVGKHVADQVRKMCQPGNQIVVFAGWGTKGAYALAAARHLLTMGISPEIYLFNIGGDRISADCANAKKFLTKEFKKCRLHVVEKSFTPPELDEYCLVVDGLFGRELDRPLPQSFGMVIRSINESKARIVSIDIPTGLFSEWNTGNTISRDIIHATVTLAIEFPCLSFFMNENIKLVGELHIIDIGLNQQAIRQAQTMYSLVTKRDMHRILRHRSADTSKADYGSAMICAGQYGMMGAAVLAARGCLRAGAGKVTCYGPRCGYQVMQTAVPCAMFVADAGDSAITKVQLPNKYSAIAIGPGIGTSDATINAVQDFMKLCFAKHRPLVIDADALNCIAERPLMLNYLPPLSVLTPHAGEFDRIFGPQPSTEARLAKALEVAAYHNIIILLKGRYTMIVRSDGKVYINSSGTPALATPGSGDVLTGVITALIAQGYTPEMAAVIGAYVHGYAGELAEQTHGEYGVTASDVADCIGRSIKDVLDYNP